MDRVRMLQLAEAKLPHQVRAPLLVLPAPRAVLDVKSYKKGAEWAQAKIAEAVPPPDQEEQARAFAVQFLRAHAQVDARTRGQMVARLNLPLRFRLEPPDMRNAKKFQVMATQKISVARSGYMDWKKKADASFWEGARDYATAVVQWWMDDGDQLIDYSDSLFAAMGI